MHTSVQHVQYIHSTQSTTLLYLRTVHCTVNAVLCGYSKYCIVREINFFSHTIPSQTSVLYVRNQTAFNTYFFNQIQNKTEGSYKTRYQSDLVN